LEEAATNLDPLLKLKAESFLVTLPLLHLGHCTLALSLKTIFSKSSSHLGQWYSKMGIPKLLFYFIITKGSAGKQSKCGKEKSTKLQASNPKQIPILNAQKIQTGHAREVSTLG
jgi:hypothetical protein